VLGPVPAATTSADRCAWQVGARQPMQPMQPMEPTHLTQRMHLMQRMQRMQPGQERTGKRTQTRMQ
jgi:hypothetical protein